MPADAPQCPSCTFNIPTRPYYLAGKLSVDTHCRKQIAMYPNATHCPYYQREPGAD